MIPTHSYDRKPSAQPVNHNGNQNAVPRLKKSGQAHVSRTLSEQPLGYRGFQGKSEKLGLNESFQKLSLQESTTKNSVYMKTRDIDFSQKTVSRTFSDGGLLDDAVYQLNNKKIKPEHFPTIRIVKFNGQWVSLDNRRLRVFLDAFIETVPVIKLDLKDPEVAKEFWSKKSNKSLSGGGVVRSNTEVSHGKHFDEGNFIFNKNVLKWTVEMIQNPTSKLIQLPDIYDNRAAYYEYFKNLIYEEARAILQIGLELFHIGKAEGSIFELFHYKRNVNAENPTEMKFNPPRDFNNDIKAGDALLLEHTKFSQLKLIALANYSELTSANPKISFKVVVDHGLLSIYNTAFEAKQQWQVTPIGSLITLQRMFDACTTFSARKETFLEKCIYQGTISPSLFDQNPVEFFDDDCYFMEEFPRVSSAKREKAPLSFIEQKLLAKLNPSQALAVKKFLLLEEGLQLIQGPPGTGKTSTLIPLLKASQLRRERLLVCTPSNKATQVLGERFVNEYPNVPVALIGVEEKLPPDSPLCNVFVDTWGSQKISCIQDMCNTLWKLQPAKLVEGEDRFLKNRIKEAEASLNRMGDEFSALAEEVALYKLSILQKIKRVNTMILQVTNLYVKYLSRATSEDWKKLKENKANKFEEPEDTTLLGKAHSLLSMLALELQSAVTEFETADGDFSAKGLKAELINNSALVFSTLSTCGQQRLKEIMLPFDTLIIDEAAQAVEAEITIALKYTPKKCLLIGDIKQLPATVISPYAEKTKFGRSLMERLIKDCDQPYSLLNIQYRMDPEISCFPSKKYYGGRLENAAPVTKYDSILPKSDGVPSFMNSPYAFINVTGHETKNTNHSYINESEARYVKLIVEFMHRYGIDVINRIGIITFYKGQADYIRTDLNKKFTGIKVNTVDGFQGGECDMIIISCVRANLKQRIGFLHDSRRLNVALTRAKYSLIILGDIKTLAKDDMAELVQDASDREILYGEEFLANLQPKKLPSAKKTVIHGLQPTQSNYKTELCQYFKKDSTSCKRGEKCSYAHGKQELRSKNNT